jgi:hypothetical protein
LGYVLQGLQVVGVGQHIGWETLVGVVVAQRVLYQVRGCVLVDCFLDNFIVNDEWIVLVSVFTVVRVPLEGCPVPCHTVRLDK